MNMVSAVVYKLCWWTPGGSSGDQWVHIWVADSGDWCISLTVLWLCLTTRLKVLIITFPRGLMAMPQGRMWRGSTRWVSRSHSCFEFIIFLYCFPPLISSAERVQWLKIFWMSGVWVKSGVVSQKTGIDLLSKHTVMLRNCLTLWAWFLHFKKEEVSLGDL